MSESNIWSIKNGDVETIVKYIESNPKQVNEIVKGRTYLHYACDYGQRDIIEFLLSKGADINAEDNYNITPLLAAVWEDHVSCVELLVKKGANTKVKAPDGKSVLESTENESIKKLLK